MKTRLIVSLITTFTLCFGLLSCSDDNNEEQIIDTSYENYIGTWNVLEIEREGESGFVKVSSTTKNTVVFGNTDISIRITVNETGDKIFSEICDFTSNAYFKIINNQIFGYSKKNTNHLIFNIVTIDVNTEVITIENMLTNTTYKIVKQ